MAQKTVIIPGIGEVLLAKRRGARNIRLSITARGKVRVGMPNWTPYAAGISFAKSRQEWILKHLSNHQTNTLKNGDLIGKSTRIYFIQDPQMARTSTRMLQHSIKVISHLSIASPAVQQAAQKAGEKALKKEASVLLPQRLRALARKHGFNYKSVQIKKLTSRWGSCSNDKAISLSYFLVQLPWPLIDYVLLHELVHTEHLNHSPDFWARFQNVLPDLKLRRQQIRQYKPQVQPSIS
jgi:predicted metal-dependent hydrolase